MIESTISPVHDSTDAADGNEKQTGDLVWTVDVSLLSNRLVWAGLLVCFGAGALYALTLLLALALYREDWDNVIAIVGFVAICFAFVMLLAVIAIALLGFRMPTRTTLTAKGVVQEQLSGRARGLNRLAMVLAPFAGARGATVAGSAALAASNQTVAVPWKDIYEARLLPRRHEIRLRNQWRTLLQLWCPAELYESIASRIGTEIERTAAKRPAPPATRPMPLRVIQTLLLISPSILLLAPLPLEIPVVLVILIIILGLVTAWVGGTARRTAGLLLLLASLGLPLATWWRGDFYLAPEGAVVTLALQLALLLVFALTGAAAATAGRRRRR